jgi:serine/threonine protein kinase
VDPWIGKHINDQYEIVSLIARGGMGAVYRARHLLLNTNRAIKVIRQDLNRDDVVYQRFKQEAQAVMGLSHPNIVSFHEFGVADSTPFVVMDLLEGQALDAVVKENGEIEISRALDIFMQVASALHYAHSKGIFHRDIKPSNIMLLKDEQGKETAKVLDFGIAKVQGSEAQKLTSTGEIFGSPLYMSPEQGRGQAVDARSDIYSLACVMYECLSGQPPFRGNNALETLIKHMNEQPTKVYAGKKKKDIDPVMNDFEAIISRCLDKDPAKRYASMADLEQDLKRLSYGERLLNLQREMSMRRRTQLFSRVHKYALIAFAVILPFYAFFTVYIDPSSWRSKMHTAMRYQDTADKRIQQIIADLPKKEISYEWNLASLIWNQAQILRLKSGSDPSLLERSIQRYNEALQHANQFQAKDEANASLKRDLSADCYEGLVRARIQQLHMAGDKTGFDAPYVKLVKDQALDAAARAVKLRREELSSRGINKEAVEDLSESLLLLAAAGEISGVDVKQIDSSLDEAEKKLKLYAPGTWLLADCLIQRADLAIKIGVKDMAVEKLKEAALIHGSLYGMFSPEFRLLQIRIAGLKQELSIRQSSHSAR